MLIRYTGHSKVRTVEDCTWTRQRRVLPVSDKNLVQNLVSHDGFVIDDADPLVQLVGLETAEKLVIELGICDVAELSQLKKSDVKSAAELLGVTQSQLNDWVASAKGKPPTEDVEADFLALDDDTSG